MRVSLRAGVAASIGAVSLALMALPAVASASSAPSPSGAVAGGQQFSGTFQPIRGDSFHGNSVYLPYLKTTGGLLYRLRGGQAYPYKAGEPLTVAGSVHGRNIDVASVAVTGNVPAAAATPASLNVLVELVTWTSPDGVTPAQAQQQYGVTNRAWFNNSSYGAMSVTASATKWLTIAPPSDDDGSGPNTPCDNISAIQSEGDQAAQAAGYDPGTFSNVVYYYPSCANEQWGGWGMEPGNRTWLIGEMDTRVGVHELGHNLGLDHSHSDTCTDGGFVAYSESCTVAEYGDPTSAMGAGFEGQGMYAASQEYFLGWLGTASHSVQSVSSSGTFRLEPLESSAGGTQALAVQDSSGTTFWIEYRQAIGNDAFLGTGETAGVLVRTGSNASNLYDMTPGTANNFSDAALAAGASWSDPLSNLTLSVASADANGAVVSVSMPSSDYALSVNKAGTGSGTVMSSPAGISCGQTCVANYARGTSVTLSEVPTSGSTFSGWSGACSGATNCTVPMNVAQSVTATFGAITTYQDANATYSGSWATSKCSCFSGGSDQYATTAGASATFTFTGTKIGIVSERASNRGSFAVYLDGVYKTTVTNYSITKQNAFVVWSKGSLPPGTHTIELVVVGTAGHPRVDVDAFNVTN